MKTDPFSESLHVPRSPISLVLWLFGRMVLIENSVTSFVQITVLRNVFEGKCKFFSRGHSGKVKIRLIFDATVTAIAFGKDYLMQ